MARSRRRKEQPATPVDLGLSRLLGDGPPDVAPKQEAQSVSGAQPQLGLIELAAACRWQELSARTEDLMVKEQGLSLVTARLYWVLSQAELRSVPSIMLAGPMDSIKKALLNLSDTERGTLQPLFDRCVAAVAGQSAPVLSMPAASQRRVERAASRSMRIVVVMSGALAVALLLFVGWGFFGTPTRLPNVADFKLAALASAPRAELTASELERVEAPSGLNALAIELDSRPPAVRTSAAAALRSGVSPAPRERGPLASIDISGPSEPSAVRNYRQNPEVRPDGAGPDHVFEDQAPEFRDFRTARYLEVLVSTKVMSAPSLRSETLAELDRGVRLEVEGKEGYWYKVRSRSGRVGYVLGQDLADAP